MAELKKLNAEIKEIKEVFNDILKWIKFDGKQKAIQIFKTELNDDVKKIVYYLSDGMSSPKIASLTNIDETTVRNYWRSWAEKGIMEICPKYKRRYCKIISLKELGIEVPEVKIEIQKETEDLENELE